MGKYLQEVSGTIHEVSREEDEKKRGRVRVEGLAWENLAEFLS
jgi:hypothetical protein